MKKPMVIALAVAGVLVLAVGGGIAFWQLNDSAEDEFQLSDSAGDDQTAGDAAPTTAATNAGTPPDLTSDDVLPPCTDQPTTWVIGDGSEAGYRIDEELRGLDKTATGRTEDVSGEITAKCDEVFPATVTVQTGTLTSDSSMRDTKVRENYLQADEFPTATFTLIEPIPFGAEPAVGEPVTTTANGTLELHGVTRDVTVEIDAQLTAEDALEVVGSTPIALADYDIEVPDIGGFVKAAPKGTLEFKLALTPA